jgi:UDP-N-acetylmuramate dehydrogenase
MADDLTRLNTLGLRSVADRLVEVRQLSDLARWHERHGAAPVTVLGGGSNVVLRGRLTGSVLLMRNRGLALEAAGDGIALLTAAAGERWHDVVRFALGQGYAGLENLALIPGCAGAAPIQNIGAYGVELADRFERLRAFDLASGRTLTFDRADCRFAYRESRFKEPGGERFVVVDVTLKVARRAEPVLGYPDIRRELAAMGRSRPSAVDVAEAVIRVRRRKLPDPRRLGNVGSFFKNPVVSATLAGALAADHPGLAMHPVGVGEIKLAAAQLIDRCGWKGTRRGAVGVWRRQALVLVNFGAATAPELLGLAEDIRRDVRARYGVELELEPRVLGQD